MNASGRRTPATPEGVAEHPVCACHQEPMLWQKDREYRAGGRWLCRVKRREYNARRRAQRIAWTAAKRATDPAAARRYRVYQRRSTLRAMRRDTLERLDQLRQEAEDLVAQP